MLRNTIRISQSIKEELNAIKEHSADTYDDVINRLILVFKKQEDTIIAAKDLVAGDVLKPESLMLIPSTIGLSARFTQKLVGKTMLYSVKKGKPITFGLVEL